jgi:cysteinyl-tRNA synthetase
LLFGLRVMGFDFKIKNYNFKEKKLILTWENSRKEGDYLTSDRIRKELQSESLKILPTQAQ